MDHEDDTISWVVPPSEDDSPHVTVVDHECAHGKGPVLLGFAIAIVISDKNKSDGSATVSLSLCDDHGCCVKVTLQNLCPICQSYLLDNAPHSEFVITGVVRSFKPSRNYYSILCSNVTEVVARCNTLARFQATELSSLSLKTNTTCHYPMVTFVLPLNICMTTSKRKCVRFQVPFSNYETCFTIMFLLYSIEPHVIKRLLGSRVVLTDVRIVYKHEGDTWNLYTSPNSLLSDINSPRFLPKPPPKAITVGDVQQMIQQQKRVKLADGTRGYIVFQLNMHVVVAVPKEVPLVVCNICSVFYDFD